jgi:hypothetical protein
VASGTAAWARAAENRGVALARAAANMLRRCMLLSMTFALTTISAHLGRIEANPLVIGEHVGRKMICPGRIGGSAEAASPKSPITF